VADEPLLAVLLLSLSASVAFATEAGAELIVTLGLSTDAETLPSSALITVIVMVVAISIFPYVLSSRDWAAALSFQFCQQGLSYNLAS
jgi:hypothetical protein